MPYDKWTIIDAITALMNIVCYNVIGNVTPDIIQDVNKKRTVDYYVIFVVLISWIRFFSYFLVVKPISKLLMTTKSIIVNTLSFNFLVLSVIAIVLSLCLAFLQDANI